MRKSLLFLFVSLLFFTSCKTENANKIELFNGFAFHVGAYERVLDIDSLVKKSYEQSFNNIPNIQVPLFRIVSGKDYQIYLGIPFHISPDNLAMKRKEFFSNDSIYNEVNKENTYFFKYKNSEGYYITEYIRNMDSNTVICVFAKTFNGPLNDSLLTMELLAKRISK